MAKSGKRTSIQRLVEEEKEGPEQALNAIRKYLKVGAGEPYHMKSNLLAGIIDRNRRNEKLISETGRTQWRVANISILLSIAVAGAALVSRHLLPSIIYTAGLSAAAAVAIVLILWSARKTLDTTEEDLRFYREHARLNEEMLTMTVGIEKLAASVVAARQPDFVGRRYFLNGAGGTPGAFTSWLYGLIVGAGVIAFAVSQLLVWLT